MIELYPFLLLHPNIPKPLHGLAPRVLLGDVWWQQQKTEARKRSGNCCVICGISPKEAKYHQWLETHEVYNIYSTGRVVFRTSIALCHSCHNFIHDGRMQVLVKNGKFPHEKYLDILNHGNRILSDWMGEDITFKYEFDGRVDSKYLENTPYLKWERSDCEWGDYHLILYGQRYESKFKDREQWSEYYK
jgi:hypothetical protein